MSTARRRWPALVTVTILWITGGVLGLAAQSAPACQDVLLNSSDYFISSLDIGRPLDISNAGVVVGSHGFRSRVYENYTYRDIDIPSGAHDITARAVNDAALISGDYYWVAAGVERETGWILNGTTFSTFDYPGSARTRVTAIANDGTVAGYFQETDRPDPACQVYIDYCPFKSFIRTTAGTYLRVDYPGSRNTYAESVNSMHDLVGTYWVSGTSMSHGFLYSGEAYSGIDVPGGVDTRPIEISDDGIVFGTYVKSDQTQGAFTWSPSGGYKLRDLPIKGPRAWSLVEGRNNGGQEVGQMFCVPEGSPDAFYFGYLATPARRVPLALDEESIDLAKNNPLKIGLLSTAHFSAPANAESVVLLPWQWIWSTNDLRDGTPPRRYQVKDLNGDGREDVLFTFQREALYNPTIAIRGVVLKGFLPDGELFYGLQPVEVLNNTWR